MILDSIVKICNLLVGMLGRTFKRIWLAGRHHVRFCFSEAAIEVKEEELERLNPAIGEEE